MMTAKLALRSLPHQTCARSVAQRLLGLPQLSFILLADIIGASPESVFHIALGLVDPTFYLRDGEVVLASQFRNGGLVLEKALTTAALRLAVQRFTARSLLIAAMEGVTSVLPQYSSAQKTPLLLERRFSLTA